MIDKLDKNRLAMLLVAIAVGLVASPWVIGFSDHESATLSTGIIAALLALLALAATERRLDWVGAGAMGTGAWSLIAPFLIGIAGGAAFWVHFVAGWLAMLAGLVAAELSGRLPGSRPPGQGSANVGAPAGPALTD